MNISYAGINLIKKFEGFRSEAYQDTDKYWSIGYGHHDEWNGKKIIQGMRITEMEATVILLKDIQKVEIVLNSTIFVELSQNQFDALCSLVFNIGTGAFKRSNMLLLLNNKEFDSVASEFLHWSRVGTIKDCLLNRRKSESNLFTSSLNNN
ncbi:TPA: lysozyme [Salmonella enterica]